LIGIKLQFWWIISKPKFEQKFKFIVYFFEYLRGGSDTQNHEVDTYGFDYIRQLPPYHYVQTSKSHRNTFFTIFFNNFAHLLPYNAVLPL